MSTLTDKKIIIEKGFKDELNIKKRLSIYPFTYPYYDIVEEVIKQLHLVGKENILDIGCGDGRFLLKVRTKYADTSLTGIDISAGIFKNAEKSANLQHLHINFQTGDAQSLAFPDESFDRIIAMHMLYHVPDIGKAIYEISRIMKKDGIAIITANSKNTKKELKTLNTIAANLMGTVNYPDSSNRFNIEEGKDMLRKHFSEVSLIEYKSVITLTDPQPYVDFFDSIRGFWEPYPNDTQWNTVLTTVHTYIEEKIRMKGKFEDENIFGIF